MKSLLIKDFKILMQLRTSLIMFLIISIFMVINGVEISFCIGYATMLVTILMIGTISYDEHENGMSFLMTLPISRKQYALSKYLFSMIGITLTDILILLTIALYKVCTQSELLMTEYVTSAILLFFTAIIMSSFMIPVHLKYGVEKSRLVLLLFAGVISIITLAFSKFDAYIPSGIKSFIMRFATAAPAMLVVFFGVTALVVFIISLICSVHIIEKKDY